MKKTIVGSLLAGAFLALTAFSAQAQDKVYKVGMDQTDYPPFATKDTAGNWTSWEIDMAPRPNTIPSLAVLSPKLTLPYPTGISMASATGVPAARRPLLPRFFAICLTSLLGVKG